MRTTIDLPPDLHHVVSSIAVHTRRSMSKTVAELIQRGLSVAPEPADANEGSIRVDAVTGMPLIRSPRLVTAEDVRSLEDE